MKRFLPCLWALVLVTAALFFSTRAAADRVTPALFLMNAVTETPAPSETPAGTPEPSGTPAPSEMPPETAFPKVIDRINDPAAYPDFAFNEGADLLEIWFPPIRDQDCAFFRYQGQVWMLDCGDERAEYEIVPLLKALGITKIDRMINTHPHHDHLNGLYAIDAAVPVGELYICFPEDATVHMTAAMEYCKGNGIPVFTFADESVLGMGDGFVSFLAWQKSTESDTLNNQSAQFRLTYGVCSMLFMADLEYKGQRQLEAALPPEELKADILRYPHHGVSRMTDPLFDAIDPDLAIITNTARIVELRDSTRFLALKHTPVAYTHRPASAIHLQTDGASWLCEQIPLAIDSTEEAEDAEANSSESASPAADSPTPGTAGGQTPADENAVKSDH